jgi:hypothetical protein
MARPLGSAIGRLLAVFDRAEDADRAIAGLTEAGITPGRIQRLIGPADADALDASGRRGGLRGRLFRIIEFTWADQAPDFAAYEAALREGHQVVVVRVRGQEEVRRVAHLIDSTGGHFVNHFGWFETQELARWKGKEPDLPGFLRR